MPGRRGPGPSRRCGTRRGRSPRRSARSSRCRRGGRPGARRAPARRGRRHRPSGRPRRREATARRARRRRCRRGSQPSPRRRHRRGSRPRPRCRRRAGGRCPGRSSALECHELPGASLATASSASSRICSTPDRQIAARDQRRPGARRAAVGHRRVGRSPLGDLRPAHGVLVAPLEAQHERAGRGQRRMALEQSSSSSSASQRAIVANRPP